jgi:hypothetical protein
MAEYINSGGEVMTGKMRVWSAQASPGVLACVQK